MRAFMCVTLRAGSPRRRRLTRARVLVFPRARRAPRGRGAGQHTIRWRFGLCVALCAGATGRGQFLACRFDDGFGAPRRHLHDIKIPGGRSARARARETRLKSAFKSIFEPVCAVRGGALRNCDAQRGD